MWPRQPRFDSWCGQLALLVRSPSPTQAFSTTSPRKQVHNTRAQGRDLEAGLGQALPQASSRRVDTLGFEPRAFRMRSGCDTTTPCALEDMRMGTRLQKPGPEKEGTSPEGGSARAARPRNLPLGLAGKAPGPVKASRAMQARHVAPPRPRIGACRSCRRARELSMSLLVGANMDHIV